MKCVPGLESTNDALVIITDTAAGYPKAPSASTTGSHPPIQQSWNGQGPTPVGWSRHFTANWTKGALDAQVPISDTEAAALQTPSALANLNAGQITTLTTAILARVEVDLGAQGYVPKANGVGVTPGPAVEDSKG